MIMTCEQFETLMHFYFDNDLSESIKSAFESHMKTCKPCRDKYKAFQGIISDLRDSYKHFSEESLVLLKKTGNSQNINSDISAYVDNELDVHENVKIKKMIITKPDIRQKVERMYNLKLLLKDSFDKSTPKQDYSQKLVEKIYSNPKDVRKKDILFALISFVVLSTIWVIMLVWTVSI